MGMVFIFFFNLYLTLKNIVIWKDEDFTKWWLCTHIFKGNSYVTFAPLYLSPAIVPCTVDISFLHFQGSVIVWPLLLGLKLWPKAIWWRKGLTSFTAHCPLWREAGQEHQAESQRNTTYWLPSHGLLNLLFWTAHSGLVPHTSMINQ